MIFSLTRSLLNEYNKPPQPEQHNKVREIALDILQKHLPLFQGELRREIETGFATFQEMDSAFKKIPDKEKGKLLARRYEASGPPLFPSIAISLVTQSKGLLKRPSIYSEKIEKLLAMPLPRSSHAPS
jgi:hypothetical protein